MASVRALLISRIGPHSLHRHWLTTAGPRSFDVMLSAYDPAIAPVTGEGVLFEHRQGRKVEGYGAILRDHAALIARYDHVALFDDDLLIGGDELNRLFDIVRAHNLKIAQPALTTDSHYTYAALLRHPGFLLRYMTYVEMMCPVFRADVLAQVGPLYGLGYESGIDLIWSNLVWSGPRDFAVIDAAPVTHTQRVGAAKSANGFVAGKRYEDDIHAILGRFGCEWLPCLPYGGIRTDGTQVKGRAAMLPAAFDLVRAVSMQPPVRRRARNLAVYWKHLLTAPARNMTLEWPMVTTARSVRA